MPRNVARCGGLNSERICRDIFDPARKACGAETIDQENFSLFQWNPSHLNVHLILLLSDAVLLVNRRIIRKCARTFYVDCSYFNSG